MVLLSCVTQQPNGLNRNELEASPLLSTIVGKQASRVAGILVRR